MNDVPTGAVTYLELAEQACQRIYLACQNGSEGQSKVKAVVDSYNPAGSTCQVGFNTSKPVYSTEPSRCHVNFAVLDSDWEAQLGFVLDHHPRVLAWVKNQGLGFEVPYHDGGTARVYMPDFLVRLDCGGAEPLNLVLEVKGFRGSDAQLKASTMEALWVPGVNNLGTWGSWAFKEFRYVHSIEDEFEAFVTSVLQGVVA